MKLLCSHLKEYQRLNNSKYSYFSVSGFDAKSKISSSIFNYVTDDSVKVGKKIFFYFLFFSVYSLV